MYQKQENFKRYWYCIKCEKRRLQKVEIVKAFPNGRVLAECHCFKCDLRLKKFI